jgi:hypothetical protein
MTMFSYFKTLYMVVLIVCLTTPLVLVLRLRGRHIRYYVMDFSLCGTILPVKEVFFYFLNFSTLQEHYLHLLLIAIRELI